MRLVLDTNVLVAAFATQGQCYRLLRHCVKNHSLVTSAFLLQELESKLLRKIKIAPDDVEAIMSAVRSYSKVVVPEPLAVPVCRDPDDDWVLATAVTGQCRCIVTGDRDLLVLRRHDAIDIVSPAEFWRLEDENAKD
ncbi:MAG TPA: putative toxin-antitoxin system toxin component, PIN family [Longimicrobium sp.]